MAELLTWIFVIAAAILSLYGLLGVYTLWLYWRHRNVRDPLPIVTPRDMPLVTVQLPIYNEQYVVERLIRSAAALTYPREKLHIQVVDDSDDVTSDIAARLVSHFRARDINIDHVRRTHRNGYKAGAMAAALTAAEGEFVAVFDADFRPQPDFLLRTIPYFQKRLDLGMIQARWGHLNAHECALTGAQAIALDKHFVIEQTVRHRANFFPKFNGAAGVWRRHCIEDAGGWLDDTVCEDLCLSTRAVLRGWRFQFLPDVVAPAELPLSISAYKNQQARWAKGSIQCFNKYAVDILRSKQYPLRARLYALIAMSAYVTHFLLLLLLLVQVPLILFDVQLPPAMILFSLLGLGQPLLFALAQKESYSDWWKHLLYLPALLLIAIGTSPSNSQAILQACFGRHHPFIRTPKGVGMRPRRGKQREYGQQREGHAYGLPRDRIWLIEFALVCYAAVGVGLAIAFENMGSLFLLLSSVLGFGYVLYLGLRENVPNRVQFRRKIIPRPLLSRIHRQDAN